MEVEKNLKNIKKAFKEEGIFYTTNELAQQLKEYVDFKPMRIYDPTCGQGNLLSVFPDEIEKYGQEIHADELEKAKSRLKNFHGYCGDTLKDDGFRNIKFDLIVANPPFSIRWDPDNTDERFKDAPAIPPPSKADYAFILHILYHLDTHGKAICLGFPGILYRGQREGIIRQWLIDNNYIERIVHIPEKSFVDTPIATCIIVISKSKMNTDIVFEDKKLKRSRTVTREEIVANNYQLSVSIYIQEEKKKEFIDVYELQNAARKNFIKRLKKELEFDREVCRMEGWDETEYIKQLQELLNSFKA